MPVTGLVAPTTGQALKWNGAVWQPSTLGAADVSLSGTSPWTNCTLGSGWANIAGANPMRWRIHGNTHIHVEGACARTSGTGTTAFFLPTGVAPEVPTWRNVVVSNGLGSIGFTTFPSQGGAVVINETFDSPTGTSPDGLFVDAFLPLPALPANLTTNYKLVFNGVLWQARAITSDDIGWTMESWTDVPFDVGWANFGVGLNSARYRKIWGGIAIELQGVVKRTVGTTLQIATLPAGYRPAAVEWHSALMGTGTGLLSLAADGKLVAVDYNRPDVYTYLDGIIFNI